MDIEKEIYDIALRKWGCDMQFNILIEECSELIKAICKYKRNPDLLSVNNLIEEIVDVEIMIKQIKLAINGSKYNEIKFKKLSRLKKRLEDEM